jgi:hypothetical protein
MLRQMLTNMSYSAQPPQTDQEQGTDDLEATFDVGENFDFEKMYKSYWRH